MTRIKGSKNLVFDAIEETTRLVERMHVLVSKKTASHFSLGDPLSAVIEGVKTVHDTTATGVYETIRLVNRGIKKLLDTAAESIQIEANGIRNGTLQLATPQRSDAKGSQSWLLDHAEATLNALYGDYLTDSGNALDIGMSFRHQGNIVPLEKSELERTFPDNTGKICVFIHGLACTEWSWNISAEKFYGDPSTNFGSQLKQNLDYTPLYVRYNSGRHISENGRLLSTLLTQLSEVYPCELKEIVLVGHSMGGLVARSAAFYGNEGHEPWIRSLRHIVCLGSPNLGAPIEKAANLISSLLRVFNTPGTLVPADILDARSAGIKDLRFGYTVDDEWSGKDPDAFFQNHRQKVPFVDGVGYCFIAATITRDPNHPMGALLGDCVVRLPSATGRPLRPTEKIPFTSGNIFSGMNHMHLANHPDVYQAIKRCIEMSPVTGYSPTN